MSTVYEGVGDKKHTRLQQIQSSRAQQDVARAIDSRHQTKKDIKSIGQNLYDSFSMIYSYSKLIPSSMFAFDALRAQCDDTQRGKRASGPNESSVTVRTNDTASIARQHSQQDLRAQSQAHASQDLPEVLSNGQQVHKVPYRRPSALEQAHVTRNANSDPIDLKVDTPKMSIAKTGRKSFTLGGSIAPSMVRTQNATEQAPSHQQGLKSKHISHATIPSTSILSCDVLDRLKDRINSRGRGQGSASDSAVGYDTGQQTRPTEAFVKRSLFYSLSDPETLLKSFRDAKANNQQSPLPHLSSARLTHSFRDWDQRNGALIFDSLSTCVEALFTRPPELAEEDCNGRPKYGPRNRYLNNHEAAHIVMICIHALTSSVPVGWPRSWKQLRSLRSWGVVAPSASGSTDGFVDPYVNIIDALEHEPALRLADRLLQGIGVRNCFDHILQAMHVDVMTAQTGISTMQDSLMSILVRHLEVVESIASEHKQKMKPTSTVDEEPGWTVTATFMEWLKTTIIKKWDGNMEINKWCSVGTAVLFLHELC